MTDLIMGVGETAGRVWRLLNAEGEMPLDEITRALEDRLERVTLAVGWLAREDKLRLRRADGVLFVSLKENGENW